MGAPVDTPPEVQSATVTLTNKDGTVESRELGDRDYVIVVGDGMEYKTTEYASGAVQINLKPRA